MQGKELGMRNLLFIGAAAAALVAAAPASAQVYMGGDPGGVGVRAGPFAFGVGPGYRDPYAYGSYGYGAYGDDYGGYSAPRRLSHRRPRYNRGRPKPRFGDP